MLYGLVDLGSNSIRLSIYRVEDGDVKILMNKKETAGLSTYVKNGGLTQAGMNRASHVLYGFLGILDNFGISEVFVFATASLRNIVNTAEVVSYLRQKTGISVEVLSGPEEARLGFVGATRTTGIRDGVLIDIGGGSTELTEFQNGAVISACSMPVGSLNLYIRHVRGVLPSKKNFRDIRLDVLEEMDKVSFSGRTGQQVLYGIGGTLRGTVKLANELFGLPSENREITCENLSGMLLKFKESKQSRQFALQYLLQTSPERIHTLVPGMILLKTVAKHFGSQIILASSCGVREGYLYDRILGGGGYVDAGTGK